MAFIGKDISAEKLIEVLKRVGHGACPINETLLSRPSAAKKVLQLFKNLSNDTTQPPGDGDTKAHR